VNKPYGTWPSPISAEAVATQGVRLGSVAVDGDDVYWLERRPNEGGRSVLERRRVDGRHEELTPQGFNVRTRVHEYGGGAYIVAGGQIYFSNFSDQRVYRGGLSAGSKEQDPAYAVTPANDCFLRGFQLRLDAQSLDRCPKKITVRLRPDTTRESLRRRWSAFR
jgi:hypothetical protein